MVFLGRIDHQVKINGVRVELGEVEHQLQSISWINQAVVVDKDVMDEKNNVKQKILVSYYTEITNKNITNKQEIQSILRSVLPEYMIPSVYIPLEQMPLNPNGKIDRKSLANRVIDEIYKPDMARTWTEFERKVVDLWENTLNTPIHSASDFFEAGGNSMLAISLINKVNSLFTVELHAQNLIENSCFDDFVGLLVKLNH